MDADEFIINVIAKKNNGTIELSVPDDVFNQAERILLKNEQCVFCKTLPAEAFGSDSWIYFDLIIFRGLRLLVETHCIQRTGR